MPSTNTTIGTATDLGTIPFTLSQDVSDTAAPNYEVWYKYTAAADERIFGFWAGAVLAGNYTPQTIVFLGPIGAPVQYMPASVDIDNVPISVPSTPGETYYFRIRQVEAGTPSPNVNLSVTGVAMPSAEIPAGSVMVNDEVAGFPLAALSASTGSVLQLIPNFPAGESVGVFADGTLIVESSASEQIAGYDATLTQQWVQDYPTGMAGNLLGGISSDRESLFYVAGHVNPPVVVSLNAAGVQQDTWTLTTPSSGGVIGIAPSRDNTILYYVAGVGYQGSLERPVHRWDLTTGSALADLVSGVSTFSTKRDVLVLADGSILVGYTKSGTQSQITRYNDAGATLNTYTMAVGESVNRLAHAVDDPDSFWVWNTVTSAGSSRFVHVRVSDGTELVSWTVAQFNQGVYAADISDTPIRFGHSGSCPFWIQAEAANPDDDSGILGFETELPIRWVLRTGVIT